jgi:hypothetical protein
MVRSKFNNMREELNSDREHSQELYDKLRKQLSIVLPDINNQLSEHDIWLKRNEELISGVNQSIVSLIDG